MKVLVGAFNQEKALVGAFSVIVKTDCGTDGSFYSTNLIWLGISIYTRQPITWHVTAPATAINIRTEEDAT